MEAECNVRIAPSPIAGNGLLVDSALPAGETIARIDRPLAAVLDYNHIDDTCANCFWMTSVIDFDGPKTVSACTGCRRVKYCSRACQRESWKRTHKHECKLYQKASLTTSSLVRCALQCLVLFQHGSEEEQSSIARMSSYISAEHKNHKAVREAIETTLTLFTGASDSESGSSGLVHDMVAMARNDERGHTQSSSNELAADGECLHPHPGHTGTSWYRL